MRHRVTAAGASLCILAAAGFAALTLKPPQALRVAAAYSAKIVCSGVFVAGRAPEAVLRDDVQATGIAPLRLMRAQVDRETQTVRAGLLGVIGQGLALHRPGTGCAVVADGDLAAARHHHFEPAPIAAPSAERDWPQGSRAAPHTALAPLLDDATLAGPGWRALAVVHRGRLVGERYASGVDATTPLLGWSMTKTVTAALVGLQVAAGKLALTQRGFWPDGDTRAQISLADLLAMQSGLRFEESYGLVSDVTRMLYLEPDMAAYARAQPLAHAPGTVWSYASGSTLILSQLWQQAAGAEALQVPHRQLFAPLGMATARMEADARGTYVGSSYMYASAQDWARFAQFLLQDGQWQGRRLLPEGYVAHMRTTAAASHGEYGQGQLWRRGPQAKTGGATSDAMPAKLPDDTYWLLGHDGQSIAVVPSRELVLVRLGLTPSSLAYRPQPLLAAVLAALD